MAQTLSFVSPFIGPLSASFTTLFTVPANTQYVIQRLLYTNTDAAAPHTASIQVVRGATTMELDQETITSGGILPTSPGWVLLAGDVVQGKDPDTKISAFFSGLQAQ